MHFPSFFTVVALVPLLVACAESPSRPASAPVTAGADSESSGSGQDAPATLDAAKKSLRDLYCKPDGKLRKCVAVPDDDACSATFDEAWPECTRGVVLHEGESSEDREAGRATGRCIKRHFAQKFALTHAEGCH